MSKKILITGADHGLGFALAEVFLKNGYTVFAGSYKNGEMCHIARLEGTDNLHIIKMDVSDTQSVSDAFNIVEKQTDSLDVIINNAAIIEQYGHGGNKKTIYDKLDFDEMLSIYNVNALGPLRVANMFMPLLAKGEEKLLVNISSEAGSISNNWRDGEFGYCMSKAANNMLGALIHKSLHETGGQVYQIHPGYLQTYMSGKKNMEAHYSAEFSAEHIYKLICDCDKYRSKQPVYMDLFGEPITW